MLKPAVIDQNTEHAERAQRITTEARVWLHQNSIVPTTGEVPASCVINSLQCLMLDVLGEAMVLIAQGSTSDTVWERTDTLHKLTKWSDKCIAELGELQ